MFILIPLVLISGSLAVIFFIIYKKLPQLKNISLPEGNTGSVVHDSGGSPAGKYKTLSIKLFNDFFPEITEIFRKIKFKEYKNSWLAELEKILRRLRVFSLKMDRFSDHLIKKIRAVGDSKHQINLERNSEDLQRISASHGIDSAKELKTNEAAAKRSVKVTKNKSSGHTQDKPAVGTIELLKSEEQKLIMEIAKNPKDYRLYETLGDLYVKMENFGDAKESYEAAMELNPHGEILVKKHSQALEKMIK